MPASNDRIYCAHSPRSIILNTMEPGLTTPEDTYPLPPEMDPSPWVRWLQANRFRQPDERGEQFSKLREQAREASTIAHKAIMSSEPVDATPHSQCLRSQSNLDQGQAYFTRALAREIRLAGDALAGEAALVSTDRRQEQPIEYDCFRVTNCCAQVDARVEDKGSIKESSSEDAQNKLALGKRDRGFPAGSPKSNPGPKRLRNDSGVWMRVDSE